MKTRQIKSYAWDQGKRTVKLIITLPGVESIPRENITATITGRMCRATVNNLADMNHKLSVGPLAEPAVEGDCTVKVSKNRLRIVIKKAEPENWKFLLQADKDKDAAKK